MRVLRLLLPLYIFISAFDLQAENPIFSGGTDQSGSHSFFLAGISGSRKGFIYKLLAEWINISRGMVLEKNSPQKNKYGFFLETEDIVLTAGSRFIPGPEGGYRLDIDRFTPFFNVPNGRKENSLFISYLRSYYLPGIFFLEGYTSPGIFFIDMKKRFALIWHPASRTGNLTVSLHEKIFPFLFYADINKDDLFTTGFVNLSDDETKPFQFRSQIKRSLPVKPEEGITSAESNYKIFQHHQIYIPIFSFFHGSVSFAQNKEKEEILRSSEGRLYIHGANPIAGIFAGIRRRMSFSIHTKKDKLEITQSTAGVFFGEQNRLELLGELQSKLLEIQLSAKFPQVRVCLSAAQIPESMKDTDFIFLKEESWNDAGGGFYRNKNNLIRFKLNGKYIYFRYDSYLEEKKKYSNARLYFEYGF